MLPGSHFQECVSICVCLQQVTLRVPLGGVVCVAGVLGGGSVGRRRSREPGVSGGEGLCQGSRGGRMDESWSPSLLVPGAQDRDPGSGDTQHHTLLCGPDQVSGAAS